MDAFFAAVEVLDNPSLAGQPVIVGGSPEGHGVVSTASYEARKYGVGSAMPASQAVRLCPHGVFLKPRHSRYVELSRAVFSVFHAVTPLVEGLSIDEAFLDITTLLPSRRTGTTPTVPPQRECEEAQAIARQLQADVYTATGGLTCSVGIAENKFLAKVASDLEKPAGSVLVPPGTAESFLAPLAVEKLWGVGPRTAERLHRFGLYSIGDVVRLSLGNLEALLGLESGRRFFDLARGLDERPVRTERECKSVSHETTFGVFLSSTNEDAIRAVLLELADSVSARLRAARLWGKTVTLKVRDETFRTFTRSATFAVPTQLLEDLMPTILDLYRQRVHLQGKRIRLLGVGVSHFSGSPVVQLDLFDGQQDRREKADKLARLVDAVREKAGKKSITRGSLLERNRHTRKQDG